MKTTTMKRTSNWLLIAVILVVGSLTSCARHQTTAVSTPPSTVPGPAPTPIGPPIPAPTPDPIVVNAERTLSLANHTFDLIVHLERENQAAFAKASPAIHPFVEGLRRNGLKWLRTGNTMKQTYKYNRSPQNRANLVTAVGRVRDARPIEAIHQSKAASEPGP